METGITFTFAAIFLGAAVLSSIALYARQPIIIAYIALGVALGPFGLGVVSDMELVSGAGHVGIILLLFLLGLDMKPIALWNSLRQSTLVALISAIVFAAAGYGLSHLFGFRGADALLISAALVFSSTIIGIKSILIFLLLSIKFLSKCNKAIESIPPDRPRINLFLILGLFIILAK